VGGRRARAKAPADDPASADTLTDGRPFRPDLIFLPAGQASAELAVERLVISMGRTVGAQQDEIDMLRGRVATLTEELEDAKSLAGIAIMATLPGAS
jgi:hypothetical protein